MMESMDYNYFASAAPQPYQYVGFGADAGFCGSVSNDGSGPITVRHQDTRFYLAAGSPRMLICAQSLENSLDSNAFLGGSFDYAGFDSSLSGSTGLTPLPTTSASPPAQQLSLLPNGSVDSGIALDMDHEMQGRRGSSEEKESHMSPAQSRRKAQNRAA